MPNTLPNIHAVKYAAMTLRDDNDCTFTIELVSEETLHISCSSAFVPVATRLWVSLLGGGEPPINTTTCRCSGD